MFWRRSIATRSLRRQPWSHAFRLHYASRQTGAGNDMTVNRSAIKALTATPRGYRRSADNREREAMTEDWGKISADLERLLKLRSFVFGMKLFEKREEMEAIPRIRRPQN